MTARLTRTQQRALLAGLADDRSLRRFALVTRSALTDLGYVESFLLPRAGRGGFPARGYRLTPAGVALAQQLRAAAAAEASEPVAISEPMAGHLGDIASFPGEGVARRGHQTVLKALAHRGLIQTCTTPDGQVASAQVTDAGRAALERWRNGSW